MKVTVVIPTRNRANSLRATLHSLLSQIRRPDEIIVVDSSDERGTSDLKTEFATAGVIWRHTPASVCVQRNRGIGEASGDWIFLCDDDIELAPNYLSVLADYVALHPECGAVAGRLLQYEGYHWVDQYPVRSFRELVWRFTFQLSIWGSIDNFHVPFFARPLYSVMRRFYNTRRNTLSLAGWPLITGWKHPVFRTTIYSLGANLIRKQWLIDAPYDETLDPSGIGDNYGVALQFPGSEAIHVVASTFARHRRALENRPAKPLIYYRRLLALHYFLLKEKRGRRIKFWFTWSLIGNTLMFFFKGDQEMSKASIKAIWGVVTSRNPYWNARSRDETNVTSR